jgi:hypothetical protein
MRVEFSSRKNTMYHDILRALVPMMTGKGEGGGIFVGGHSRPNEILTGAHAA